MRVGSAWACALSLIWSGYGVVTKYHNERFRDAVEVLADRENGTAREAILAASVAVASSPALGRVVRCLLCNVYDEDIVREICEANPPPLMIVSTSDWGYAVTLCRSRSGGYNGDDG